MQTIQENKEATKGANVAELRALLQTSPSRESWLAICHWLVQASQCEPQALIDVHIPYVREHVEGWPSSLRMAPLDWVPKMVNDELPYDCLSIVSAVSLTPFFSSYMQDEDTASFLKWLENMPEDCGALEGLHASYNDKVAQDASIEYSFLGSDELCAALRSPMCRELRVLDASVQEFRSDIYSPSQDDERAYLYMHDLLSALQSTQLKVLLLNGQPGGELMCTDRVTPSSWKKLDQLEVLDLGGCLPMAGHMSRLARKLPSLKQLRLIESDSASDSLFGDWEDHEEEKQDNLGRYWSVYEFNWKDFKTQPKGLKDILALPNLELVITPHISQSNTKLNKIVEGAKESRPTLEIYTSDSQARYADKDVESHFKWETYISL